MKKLNVKIILSMIIGVMFYSNSIAVTCIWEGSVSTNWSDPNNWLDGSVPGPTDDVLFDWNSLNDCTLDITTSIHSLSIDVTYGNIITFPSANILYISGDLYIGNPWIVWNNSANIVFDGTGDQHIEIDNYTDWSFYDLTIAKSSGQVILDSDIEITHVFDNASGTTIITNGFSIIGGCAIRPQTGNIYTISNSWGL